MSTDWRDIRETDQLLVSFLAEQTLAVLWPIVGGVLAWAVGWGPAHLRAGQSRWWQAVRPALLGCPEHMGGQPCCLALGTPSPYLVSGKISGYTLTVQASDNGSPPRANTTTVNIDVSDVNDNPPVFSRENYSVIVQVTRGAEGTLNAVLWG